MATLAALVMVIVVLMMGLISRSVHVMERVLAHLEVSQVAPSPRRGSVLPDLELVDGNGEPARMDSLRARSFVLLLLSPACPSCVRLLQLIGRTTETPVAPVVMVTDISAAAELVAEPPPSWVTVFYQRDHAATRALDADRTPIAIAYDQSSRVSAVEVPTSVDDLIRLSRPSPPTSADRGSPPLP